LVIGVPVVVLNFGALTELVNAGLAEGVNSFDAEEIAEAFSRATRKAYTKISDKLNIFLDWREYLSRIINIYNELLENQ